MFTVTADNETLLTERHLPTAVLRALEASDERDGDVVLGRVCWPDHARRVPAWGAGGSSAGMGRWMVTLTNSPLPGNRGMRRSDSQRRFTCAFLRIEPAFDAWQVSADTTDRARRAKVALCIPLEDDFL